MATIAANLKLAPAEAVEYFRNKGSAITWDWHDMERGAHAQAFTVAKATSADVLHAIQAQVDKAISSGMTFEQFKRELRPQLEAQGWWGQAEVLDGDTGEITKARLGSNRRLRTIYQTNVQTAYMAGRYKRYLADVENRPYWRYVAILDGRTRPAHRALHGKVWRWDDPIWQVIWPPNGWGCRCRVQALTEAEFKKLGMPLEDGRDAVSTIDVPVNRDGKTVPVQVVRYRDETGRERLFRPDPGWDYNPGAAHANTQTVTQSLATKVNRLPADQSSRIAADLLSDVNAAQNLDESWRGWVDSVLDDVVARERTGVLGFISPVITDQLAEMNITPNGVSVVVGDGMLVGSLAQQGARAGALAIADWLGLSAAMRTPQAVLLDRASGLLLHVMVPVAGNPGQVLVLASAYAGRSASQANVRSAYWSGVDELVARLQDRSLELLDGALTS